MLYVLMYLSAIVVANLVITQWGPSMSIITAFVCIGLDLTARDHLHDAWKHQGLVWKMALLIGTGSIISYLLSHEAKQIAIASFIAFGCAGLVDAIVYQILGEKSRFIRINGSNIPSALTDSIVFPTLAFGGLLPIIVLGQFIAKAFGGFVWSIILEKIK